jgi:hypothetical protein
MGENLSMWEDVDVTGPGCDCSYLPRLSVCPPGDGSVSRRPSRSVAVTPSARLWGRWRWFSAAQHTHTRLQIVRQQTDSQVVLLYCAMLCRRYSAPRCRSSTIPLTYSYVPILFIGSYPWSRGRGGRGIGMNEKEIAKTEKNAPKE